MTDAPKPFILKHPERYAWENIRPIRPHEHLQLAWQIAYVTSQIEPRHRHAVEQEKK